MVGCTAEIYSVSHSRNMSLESSRTRTNRPDDSYTSKSSDRRQRDYRRYDDYDRGGSSERYHHRRDRMRSPRDSRDNRRYDKGRGNDYYHQRYNNDERSSSNRHDRYRDKRSSRHHRSRSRSSSYESRSKRSRSPSTTKAKTSDSNRHRTSSSSINNDAKNINIIRASRSRSKSKSPTPDRHHSKSDYNFESMYRQSNREPPPPIIGNIDENFDKEKIHKEMQERLTQHLAREGKVYPPPKPQASHPIFANDGSFLETFKRLQEQQQHHFQQFHHQQQIHLPHHQMPVEQHQQVVEKKQIPQPSYGKRRGVKILKTGIVAKQKIIDETVTDPTNDTWAMYLQEVKKYKNVSCDADTKTRPLVK